MEAASEPQAWQDDAGDLRLLQVLQAGPETDPAAYQAAWEAFVQRHQAKVHRTATHLAGADAADEVVQETFIAFYRTLQRGVAFDRNVTGWLARVATRRALNVLRSRKRRLPNVDDPTLTAAPETASPQAERAGFADEAKRLLADLTQALPDRLRLPVVMYYCAGLTQPEIAQELDCSQQSVSERLKKGLEALKASLKRHGYASLPAALPLTDALREALTTGTAATPAPALNTIPSRIGELASQATARVAAKSSASSLLWIAAAAATVAGAAGAYVWMESRPAPAAQTAEPAAAKTPEPPGHAGEKSEAPLPYPRQVLAWNFKKGLPDNCEAYRRIRGNEDRTNFKLDPSDLKLRADGLFVKYPRENYIAVPVMLQDKAYRIRCRMRAVAGQPKVGMFAMGLMDWAKKNSPRSGVYDLSVLGDQMKELQGKITQDTVWESFAWPEGERWRMAVRTGHLYACVLDYAKFEGLDMRFIVGGRYYLIDSLRVEEIDPATLAPLKETLAKLPGWTAMNAELTYERNGPELDP
ncbi:MAG: sigma-70 family RNA polymerase sigma factor [Planctomycetes bacterium]|nr:sigma-70 family RNA polymerase sigma factor [Planctomycetota bacterium]